MFGYIYLTTNLINGKKYIGQKTYNKFLGNRYLGSGIALEKAIEKYGVSNFCVELLESCNSRHELNEREFYWISKFNAVNSENFYNMREGGHGGSVKGTFHHSESHKQYMSKILKGENNPNYGTNTNHWTEESRQKQSKNMSGSGSSMYGKKHSDETKHKISEKFRGKVRINNGIENKFALSGTLEDWLSKGYVLGWIARSSTTIETVFDKKSIKE